MHICVDSFHKIPLNTNLIFFGFLSDLCGIFIHQNMRKICGKENSSLKFSLNLLYFDLMAEIKIKPHNYLMGNLITIYCLQ